MSSTDTFDQLPVQPIYIQKLPNEAIDLGPFEISAPNVLIGHPFQCTARAQMRFLPTESLDLDVPCPADWDMAEKFRAAFTARYLMPKPIQLSLPEHGVSFEVFLKSFSSEKAIYFPTGPFPI